MIFKKQNGLALLAALIMAEIGGTNIFAAENTPQPVHVFAAASLRDVMTEAAANFEKEQGTKVELNFAGSNTLRLQIEKGAPCDVFVSADSENVQRLVEQDLVVPDSQVEIVHNTLVVVGGMDEAAFSDLLQLITLSGALSLADPETVPAGKYAKQALTGAGIWEKLQDRVVPSLDVRAALAQVEQGNARFGIVYRTDAGISKRVKVLYEVPESYHSPITYVACLIRIQPENPQTKNFFEFLKSAQVKAIFERYGFKPAHE